MNLLNCAKNIEPCQRNWDENFVIPEEHIQYILDVCTTVPTKQNMNVYSLVAITDRQTMFNIFKKAAYNPDDYNRTFMRNSQINANALLVWCDGTEEPEDERDRDLAIGISSGSAALAAAELGYSTGFCKCFVPEKITKVLRKQNIKTNNNTYLMLGIGKPNNEYNRRIPLVNGYPQRPHVSQGKKDILIRRID